MHTANLSAADETARLLHELELHIDLAYERAAELAASLPRARREERLSAVVGQPIFTHLSQSMHAIAEARGHVVAAHRSMEAVTRATGIEVRAWGDEHPKPPSAALGDVAKLSIVA